MTFKGYGTTITINKVQTPREMVREYGCVRCQKYHRQLIDPEYEAHILDQSKHGWYERPARIGEIFALEMERGEPKPRR